MAVLALLMLFSGLVAAASSTYSFPESVRRVRINLGPNLTPILPPDDETGVLLVEAQPDISMKLHEKFRGDPRVIVMNAAVAGECGVATLLVYNENKGESSSISSGNEDRKTNVFAKVVSRELNRWIVPTITLEAILKGIPQSLPIELLKTDLQGHDLPVLLAAGDQLRRVELIYSEVWLNGQVTYKGVDNSFEAFMAALPDLGFECASLGCNDPSYKCGKACDPKAYGTQESDITLVPSKGRERAFLGMGDEVGNAAPASRRLSRWWQDKHRVVSEATSPKGERLETAGGYPSPVKATGEGVRFKAINYVTGSIGSDLPDASEPGKWFSQVGQDETVAQIFQGMKGRFFVDLAANHAWHISNTYALEQRLSWKGICIEPQPRYHWKLAMRNCKVYAAVITSTPDVEVTFRMDGGMGGIVGQQYDNKEKGGSRSGRSDMEEKFRTVTLVDVLREAKAPAVIDYLSLDIEGAEEEALSEAALEAYTFLVITVERPTSTLVKRMVDKGYHYLTVHGTFGDLMFVHDSLPSFQDVMQRFGAKDKCAGWNTLCNNP